MPLAAAEEAELAALLERQDGVEPLADFIGRMTPRFPAPAHVEPLRDLFERARRRPVKALISWPPRHCKTQTIKPGLAWYLADAPSTRNAYISYGADRAEKESRGIQRLAKQAGVRLANEAVSNWTTTSGEPAGGLVAVGIGGPYTGEGTTGIQVIDDPYKNSEEAESTIQRNKVWDWFDSVARTRAEPGCSQIICHTRWHPDDLIGKLLREEPGEWEHLNFPAVEGFSEEAYQAFRRGEGPIDAIGKALWPEFWPLKELLPFMRNKHFWWALYMGSPRIRGARCFEGEVARFGLADFSIIGFRAAIGCDPAGTKKNRADHSAIVVGAMTGYGDQSKLYVLDALRMQEQIPTVVRRLRDVQTQRNLLIVCEAVAGFKAVPQMLKDIDPRLRIHEISPTQDKFLRAQPLADAWNEGRVLVPEKAPWVNEYLTEFERFTGVDDDEDDQVDATAHLWNALYRPAPKPRSAKPASYVPFG